MGFTNMIRPIGCGIQKKNCLKKSRAAMAMPPPSVQDMFSVAADGASLTMERALRSPLTTEACNVSCALSKLEADTP